MSLKETVQDAQGTMNGAEATRKPSAKKKTRQVKAYKELFEEEQRGHAAITNRVMMAVRILKRTRGVVNGDKTDIDAELVALAIETLEDE